MKTIIQNQFDGGMKNDPRDPSTTSGQIIEHFDIFTNKHKLTPQYAPESGDGDANTNKIGNYAYDGTYIYGYAQAGGTGPAAILSRTDFSGSTWTTAHGSSNIGTNNRKDADLPFFTYYAKTGKIYGVFGSQYVWSIHTSDSVVSGTAFNLSSWTTVSNGVVHPKDDTLYVGVDNRVVANFNDGWTTPLTLPASLIITSLAVYNNNLAIGCRPVGGSGKSFVYLWDRDATLATLPEIIDWGDGNLMMIEELEGYLVGVSYQGIFVNDVIKYHTTVKYSAGTAQTAQLVTFVGYSLTPNTQPSLFKGKSNNRILFPASINIGSSGYSGVWSVGRSSTGVPLAFTLEHLYSRQPTNFGPYGLIKIGDILFASFSDGGTHYVDKTDDAGVYTTTSIYETLINPGMDAIDRLKKKTLHAVAITVSKLSSTMQALIKYRVDGGAWSSALFTKTATSPDTDLTGYEVVVAADITNQGREFEFHIESLYGAEITSYAYTYEVMTTGQL